MKERAGGDIINTTTVFLSIFTGLIGLNNICAGVCNAKVEDIFYISALVSFNYWLCFYSTKSVNKNSHENSWSE